MNLQLRAFSAKHNLFNEGLEEVELQELYDLIEEVEAQGFEYSGDLSKYISTRKLGYKYPNIAGIVTMKSRGTTWAFKGGFPSNIYRIVCTILNLSSNGSQARVVGFRSYASIKG
jgi:hypothetical protein